VTQIRRPADALQIDLLRRSKDIRKLRTILPDPVAKAIS
jgi:hypothetical protein